MPNVFTPLTGGGAVVVVVVRPTLGPTQIHIHGLLLLLVVARRVRGNHEGPGSHCRAELQGDQKIT